MLHYFCSRVEHVAYYRPDEEIHTIIGEVVEPHLNGTNERKVEWAARILDSLLATCQSLGVGLHYVLAHCIKLVSEWASLHLNEATSTTQSSQMSSSLRSTMTYMFRSMTTLLTCHPEQAVAPMTRSGRDILSLAKRCYTHASTMFQREVFVDFFLAHMCVLSPSAVSTKFVSCTLLKLKKVSHVPLFY
jgi:hypothetical protein